MTFDHLVGQNMQRLRQAARLSQAQVADGLRQRGHGFQQQTVLKVEKGDRPLRLREAVDVSEVIGCEVHELYDSKQFEVLTAARGVYMALSDLASAYRSLLGEHERLRRSVASEERGHQPAWVEELLAMTNAELLDTALDAVRQELDDA